MKEQDFGREFVRVGAIPKELAAAMTNQRALQLARPCRCGCDQRGGKKTVGYVSGGTENHYFRIDIEHEEVFQAIALVFQMHGLQVLNA